MVNNLKDLKRYILADKRALGINKKIPIPFVDRIWIFEIQLRITEYFYNNRRKNIFFSIISIFLIIIWKIKCRNGGIEVPVNVIDEGLAIWHGYGIIINPKAKIGKNFSISAGCVVGQAKGKYPTLGDNVEMTIHSMVLGGVTICDNCIIAPGACVVKNVDIPYVTMGGIPAKVINRRLSV